MTFHVSNLKAKVDRWSDLVDAQDDLQFFEQFLYWSMSLRRISVNVISIEISPKFHQNLTRCSEIEGRDGLNG